MEEVTEPKAEVSEKRYPMFEDLIFRAQINSEKQGYALLGAVQFLVNKLGSDQIIQIANQLGKKS